MNRILEVLRQKWTEYLLEMCVITLSIMGAFALDRWSENAKNNAKSKSHLMELRSELNYDLQEWEKIMAFLNEVDSAGLLLNEYLSGSHSSFDQNELDEAYLKAGWLVFFSVTKIAYDNLINSGEIELIKNDSLKRKLGFLHNEDSWSRRYHDEGMLEVYNSYHNYLVKHVNPIVVRRGFQSRNALLSVVNDSSDQPKDQFKIDWKSVREDPEYSFILNQVVSNRIIQKLNYLELKKDILEIIGIIDAELAR